MPVASLPAFAVQCAVNFSASIGMSSTGSPRVAQFAAAFASQSSGRFGRDVGTPCRSTLAVFVKAANQSGEIDVNHDLGALRSNDVVGGGSVIDERQQRVSASVIRSASRGIRVTT